MSKEITLNLPPKQVNAMLVAMDNEIENQLGGRPVDWEFFPELAALLMAYYTTSCKFEENQVANLRRTKMEKCKDNKKPYNVKIDIEVWYDRNFTCWAVDEEEANTLAREAARQQTEHLIGVDIDVENDGGWTYGGQQYSTAYVEEEK